MASHIENYALLGDCRGAGLVDKSGSLDWLCLPRFDSGACFAALLGDDRHGFWRISPTAETISITRQYVHGTLVLETDFRTSTGLVRLTDFMSPQTSDSDVFRCLAYSWPCRHSPVPYLDLDSLSIGWSQNLQIDVFEVTGMHVRAVIANLRLLRNLNLVWYRCCF